MKKKIIGLFVIMLFCIVMFMPKAKAAKTLDEIQDYTITIDMNENGTMNMKYHIEWKVLDSTTEGPLEWVKIGVANKHVKDIKKASDTIKKIKYVYDGGNYVRIDFKKKYYAGQTVSFDFTLNQEYMYTMSTDGTCSYTFTPGWFADIEVKKATVKWNSNNVKTYKQGAKEEGNYLVWTQRLKKGQRMSVNTTYYQSAFKLDRNKQATNVKKEANGSEPFNARFYYRLYKILVIIAGILVVISSRGRGSYYRHSGFGYYGHHHHRHGGFGGRRRLFMCMCQQLCLCVCLCRRR